MLFPAGLPQDFLDDPVGADALRLGFEIRQNAVTQGGNSCLANIVE